VTLGAAGARVRECNGLDACLLLMLAAERGGCAGVSWCQQIEPLWRGYGPEVVPTSPFRHLVERGRAVKVATGRYSLSEAGRERAEQLIDSLGRGEPAPPRGNQLGPRRLAREAIERDQAWRKREENLRQTRSRMRELWGPQADWQQWQRRYHRSLPLFEIDDDMLSGVTECGDSLPGGPMLIGFKGSGLADEQTLEDIDRMLTELLNRCNGANDVVCTVADQVELSNELVALLVEAATSLHRTWDRQLVVAVKPSSANEAALDCFDRRGVLPRYTCAERAIEALTVGAGRI
jgi:hypothetical protein